MKTIAEYSEFSSSFDKSLIEHINVKNENKDIILDYLKNAETVGVRCSSIIDYVKNKNTGLSVNKYTDGEFVWTDEMIYHFDKYDLELSKEFEESVLNKVS